MLAKSHLDNLELESVSHYVSLLPRLTYSVKLLTTVVEMLEDEVNEIRQSNRFLASEFDESDKNHLKLLFLERTLVFSLEVLLKIQKKMKFIGSVNNIPKFLPFTISLIRIVSAQLFDISPKCSVTLSSLSVHLGSIVLDSAALTEASFDFIQSNKNSSDVLDEVQLIVDAKIQKRYNIIVSKYDLF